MESNNGIASRIATLLLGYKTGEINTTQAVKEIEKILASITPIKDNESWEVKLYDKLKLLYDVWANEDNKNNNLTELYDTIADFLYDYQTRNIP